MSEQKQAAFLEFVANHKGKAITIDDAFWAGWQARPIEPAGWPEARLIDDPPDRAMHIVAFSPRGNPPHWVSYFTSSGVMEALKRDGYTHWLPQPPPPVQPKPEELALAAYEANEKNGKLLPIEERAFRAGYLAAQQKGKG